VNDQRRPDEVVCSALSESSEGLIVWLIRESFVTYVRLIVSECQDSRYIEGHAASRCVSWRISPACGPLHMSATSNGAFGYLPVAYMVSER
jgi:hypothetical protein